MSKRKVPALSLADYHSGDNARRQKFIDDLYLSFKEYGFVIIKDHLIPVELMTRVYQAQADFFNLPVEAKLKYDRDNGGQRGYTKFGTENAKGAAYKDLKEFYHVGREQYLPNVWPEEVPDFKPAVEEFVGELDKLGDDLLSALGVSLGCGSDFLPSMVKDGGSVLRLLHYPPVPEGVVPGQMRASAHEDIDLLSLLCSPPGQQGGLELLTAEGEWLPVEANPGEIVVNLGDMLSLMCNKNLPSTTHRVKNPDITKNVSRFSIPYFIHPRGDIRLDLLPKYQHETPKLPIITSEEYLMERLREIGLKK